MAVSRGSSPTEDTLTVSENATIDSSNGSRDISPSSSTAKPDADKHHPDTADKLQKLRKLIQTSTAFSEFISQRIQTQKKQRSAAKAQAEEPEPTKNRNGKRGAGGASSGSPSKRAKVEDNSTSASAPPATDEDVYIKQPKTITGATLRDYQLAGVQWLTLLYENGLNGILADEMGLGKTLQTISFLAHLKEQGVWGPFLVVCPLSVLHNWASEFEKFAPTLPTCIYHGTPDHRKELVRTVMAPPTDLNSSAASTPASSRASTPSGRRKSKGPKPKTSVAALKGPQQTKATFPVVLTTYEMIIRDRNVLNKYSWSFVIIDEGHRLKNMESKLVQEIRTYPSANRLILTGTPLHNNLNELWSLLNFIMPKIFDDLSAFQAWFDPVAVSKTAEGSSTPVGGLSTDDSTNLISSLHTILKPFLLRRLKADVEVNLPPKKEYILYAPLTAHQLELYQCVIAGGAKLREWIVKKICGVSELDTQTRDALQDRKDVVESAIDEIEDETIADAVSKRRQQGKRKAVVYEEKDLGDDSDELSDEEELPVSSRRQGLVEKSAGEIGRDFAVKKAFTMVNNMHLQNKVMQCRKVCSHPFLFHWPNDSKTMQPVLSQDLINASGKMLLLNRLLVELFAKGHKVLIFSQFTSMLDIIEDWAREFKGWDCCRIDGTTSNDMRRDQMVKFNNAGDAPDACRLFLLSTRAGGLGINLVAADTVIFYDSDWNPQMDLQAQDRAHRIGQTRPVLIFRLVSAHTVETHILERASEKRKLEALVIAKGKFKAVGGHASKVDAESLAASLLSLEGEKLDVVNSADEQIISDADLELLLDRRPEVFKDRGVGWGKTADDGSAGASTANEKGSVAFKVFERKADELNDGLATMME